MSDKRFVWLLIASCVTTVLVAFIWKLPDAMKASSTMPTKLGEYMCMLTIWALCTCRAGVRD